MERHEVEIVEKVENVRMWRDGNMEGEMAREKINGRESGRRLVEHGGEGEGPLTRMMTIILMRLTIS